MSEPTGPDRPTDAPEHQACCAHKHIVDLREYAGVGHVIREWWECRDCNTEFRPVRAAALAGGAPADPNDIGVNAVLSACPSLTPAEQAQLDAHWPWTGSKGHTDWANPHDVIALLKARLGVTGTAGQQPLEDTR